MSLDAKRQKRRDRKIKEWMVSHEEKKRIRALEVAIVKDLGKARKRQLEEKLHEEREKSRSRKPVKIAAIAAAAVFVILLAVPVVRSIASPDKALQGEAEEKKGVFGLSFSEPQDSLPGGAALPSGEHEEQASLEGDPPAPVTPEGSAQSVPKGGAETVPGTRPPGNDIDTTKLSDQQVRDWIYYHMRLEYPQDVYPNQDDYIYQMSFTENRELSVVVGENYLNKGMLTPDPDPDKDYLYGTYIIDSNGTLICYRGLSEGKVLAYYYDVPDDFYG